MTVCCVNLVNQFDKMKAITIVIVIAYKILAVKPQIKSQQNLCEIYRKIIINAVSLKHENLYVEITLLDTTTRRVWSDTSRETNRK